MLYALPHHDDGIKLNGLGTACYKTLIFDFEMASHHIYKRLVLSRIFSSCVLVFKVGIEF